MVTHTRSDVGLLPRLHSNINPVLMEIKLQDYCCHINMLKTNGKTYSVIRPPKRCNNV